MYLKEIIDKLNLEVISAQHNLNKEVTRGYASDLLSDVMANTRKGDIWITLQVHVNIVAVAAMSELAGIILINNRKPDKNTITKANQENIPILVSKLKCFELVGRLYELGIKGM